MTALHGALLGWMPLAIVACSKARMKMSNRRPLAWAACVVLAAATPGLSALLESTPPAAEKLPGIEQQVQRQVNYARQGAGIPQLSWNERLAAEARRHAGNMAARGFFAHEDPVRGDLADRMDGSGIEWKRCAENLYAENGNANPADEAVKAWLQSPGHRKNMLDSLFSESGVGVAVRRDGTLFIVQEYLSR